MHDQIDDGDFDIGGKVYCISTGIDPDGQNGALLYDTGNTDAWIEADPRSSVELDQAV